MGITKDAKKDVNHSIAELLSASANKAAIEDRKAYERHPPPSQLSPSLRDKNLQLPKDSRTFSNRSWAFTQLRSAVVDTLTRAFPHASRTTDIQQQLLNTLTKGFSVVVNHKPATGKSFAIAMWLLSLARAISLPDPKTRRSQLTTTALIIAPNIELVLQYKTIIMHFLEATGSQEIMQHPAKFVQALHRGEGCVEQIKLLKEHRNPHILIATPTVLLDILSHTHAEVRKLVDYNRLKAIVVEEIDEAFSRYEKPYDVEIGNVNVRKKVKDDGPPPDPVAILLDYITEARKVAAINAGQKLTQPQIVIPSAVIGSNRIKKTIEIYHPSWLDGENRPGFTPFTGKGKMSPASTVMTLSNQSVDEWPSKINDNVSHHVVAYDPTSGYLRAAPITPYTDRAHFLTEVKSFNEYEESLKSLLDDALKSKDPNQLTPLLRSLTNVAPEIQRKGYPPEISAEVIESLLTHDSWPRHVIVAIGENTSYGEVVQALADRGITAQSLITKNWNATSGNFPLGRSDLFVGSMLSAGSLAPQPGKKEDTIVWLTSYSFIRGVDVPAIRHLYILHRIDRVREYITYSGRVGRWPFSSNQTTLDPRSLGRDVRPHAKVVSVILEERGVVHDDAKGRSRKWADEYSLLRGDGSEVERWMWKKESLKFGKMNLRVENYFAQSGDISRADIGDSGRSVMSRTIDDDDVYEVDISGGWDQKETGENDEDSSLEEQKESFGLDSDSVSSAGEQGKNDIDTSSATNKDSEV